MNSIAEEPASSQEDLGWVHKIAYRVDGTMTCFDPIEQNVIAKMLEAGSTVEVYREWWANPTSRVVIEVRPLPAYPGVAVRP